MYLQKLCFVHIALFFVVIYLFVYPKIQSINFRPSSYLPTEFFPHYKCGNLQVHIKEVKYDNPFDKLNTFHSENLYLCNLKNNL